MERPERIIWAAGFIDGEGCIHVAAPQPQHLSVSLSVGQQIRPPLELLEELFGGSINTHKQPGPYKDGWIWFLYGKQLGAALEQLLPYLLVKRAQAILAVEFTSTIRDGRPLTPEVKARRVAIRSELNGMNSRKTK